MQKRSLIERNSSSRITRPLFRKPTIEVTSQPSACRRRATGNAIAQPTPPPTTATFFKPSTSVGVPSGPTKSGTESPASFSSKAIVEPPTIWNMIVTAPVFSSHPAIVSGIRSPRSSARIIINCPAKAFLAMSGASISIRVTVGFSRSFFKMRNIIVLPFGNRFPSTTII